MIITFDLSIGSFLFGVLISLFIPWYNVGYVVGFVAAKIANWWEFGWF